MNSKLLIALGLAAAFVVGTMASTITSNAFVPVEQNNPAEVAVAPAPAPAVRTVTRYVEPRVETRTVRVVEDRSEAAVETAVETNDKRSWEREVLIVGGSAGAGAVIGAVAGGKKGAAIGAISGGVAGLVYDMATRKKK